MRLIRTTVFTAALAAVGFANAGTLWATDTGGNLWTVDTVTAASTLVGNHGQNLESLALDNSTGRLYAADSSGVLYELNTSTGAATTIGNTGLGNIEGMDFAGTLLFGFNFASTPSIYTIDLTTAASTLFVTSDTATGVVRTFAFNPSSTSALMATDAPSFQTLHGMATSGVTTNLGSMGDEGIYGMDFDGSDLFGLGDSGDLWQINPSTGAKTLIGSTGNQFWLGAATAAPVPEPASLIAIGLGLAAIARRRKKSA